MIFGVLGSMVWDLIDHPDLPRVERWGGIAYSLAAAAAAAPAGSRIRPIIKIGRDVETEAGDFLRTLPGVEPDTGIRVVPEPNNRVHLQYLDAEHRHESLTGGVPPWTWEELEPALMGLDGLFVNLISGFELDLMTAGRLRSALDGPLYADLHSLLLGVSHDGGRVPRPLDRPRGWLAAFDWVQVNERELGLVAGDDPDPMRLARAAVTEGPTRAVLVTLGRRGAAFVARDESGEVRTREVPVAETGRGGDPTGCGDVWGATCFMALVQGAPLEQAMARANEAASRNVAHRGADDLYTHLSTDPKGGD